MNGDYAQLALTDDALFIGGTGRTGRRVALAQSPRAGHPPPCGRKQPARALGGRRDGAARTSLQNSCADGPHGPGCFRRLALCRS